MKSIIATLVFLVLSCGCIGNGAENLNRTADVNATLPAMNETPPSNPVVQPPASWSRHNAGEFSFEYPSDMRPEIVSGRFVGTTVSGNQTIERMALSSLNTLATYGANKEGIFQSNPTKTATDFLLQDEGDDPLGILDDAYLIEELSMFTISRGVYVTEAPFRLRSSASATYTGYALSIYIPERSLHVRMRVLALDPDRARASRDNFILSFRPE